MPRSALMVILFTLTYLRSSLAMHPALLGNDWWQEWNSFELQQKNCSFLCSTGKWNTTAVNYTVPDEFRI